MDVRLRRRNKRGNLSEFPVSLLVFFMFFVFPLLNLLFFALATGTVAFITTQAAGSAAQQSSFNNALTAMQTTAQNLSLSNWGKFAKLVPQGGYNGSGADLYVVETPIGGGNANYYGPNNISNLTPNPNTYIYEYRVRTSYSIAPFLNLSAVPFINAVPLIGTKANLSWNVERSVEMAYSQGLQSNNGGGSDPFGTPPGNSPLNNPGPPITSAPNGPPMTNAPTPPVNNPVTPFTGLPPSTGNGPTGPVIPGGGPGTGNPAPITQQPVPPTGGPGPPGTSPAVTPPVSVSGPPGTSPAVTPPVSVSGPPGTSPAVTPPATGPGTASPFDGITPPSETPDARSGGPLGGGTNL